MADLTAKKSDYITRLVQEAGNMVDQMNRFRALQAEYTDNGYFDSPGAQITDADCIGDNAHMSASLITSVITSSIDMNAFLVGGFHDDNFSKAKR